MSISSLQDALFASQEKFFQELFDSELASQATAEFEKAMKELAEEEPHLVEQFQKLSEAAGRVGEETPNKKYWTDHFIAENTRIVKLLTVIMSQPWSVRQGRRKRCGHLAY